MKLRELVKYLEVDGLAPFHYSNKLGGGEEIRCKYLTNEEKDDHLKNIWNSEKVYDTSELGVYLLDCNIHELYDFYQNHNPVFLNVVKNEISFIFRINVEEYSLIFAIYVILHEVGHWVHFKASGMTGLEYALWDSKFRRESEELAIKVTEIPDGMPSKWSLAEKQVKMYRNIPCEKAADKYAYDNIEEKLKLVKRVVLN